MTARQLGTYLAVLLIVCLRPAAAADLVAATAAVHAADLPEPTAAATTPPVAAVSAAEVVYGRGPGGDLRGYLARPAGGAERLPGLLVIHEWWGLNDNIRGTTERLAAEGYVALAVDLYQGEVASDAKTAMRLMQRLEADPDAAAANLRQAYAYLDEATAGAPIGVIGWCLGGRWALQAALLMPDQIDATVIYYGQLTTDPAQLARLEMPVLGNFAGKDPLIPPEMVDAFGRTMRSLGKRVDLKIYPGARHAFANPSGTAYDAAAAEDAWQRSLAFLDRTLRAD
ncbi:MAG: dienelactone hydrolase family protein [Gammaproteobacteria bacterium]|nr:MAG: dienelactone hydrolase family protein [Gammaproteobacteria bacterium]